MLPDNLVNDMDRTVMLALLLQTLSVIDDLLQ
jgi:hypothetical protein